MSENKQIKVGDKILIDGYQIEVVTKLGEPDISFETGRVYQEIYFGMSHCDISRCQLIEDE
jgi:hypothetical protein